eukprot:1179571-Pyramimonas_sp.AAC.1
MKCKDMCKVGDVTTLAPMVLERLKIMQGETTPEDALSLVGNDAQELLRDPGRFIERPPDHDDRRWGSATSIFGSRAEGQLTHAARADQSSSLVWAR